MRLFAGDDWAEDHHDVEVMDEAGKVLARKRLPEGAAGMAQLHGLVGGFLGEDADAAEVVVGIETDRGPWVAALAAAGCLVLAVNPLQAARFRERYQVSGAKSGRGERARVARAFIGRVLGPGAPVRGCRSLAGERDFHQQRAA
jgi:hypothetical protein